MKEPVILVAAVYRVDAPEVAKVRVLVLSLFLHPLLRDAVLILSTAATSPPSLSRVSQIQCKSTKTYPEINTT